MDFVASEKINGELSRQQNLITPYSLSQRDTRACLVEHNSQELKENTQMVKARSNKTQIQ